MMASVLKTHKTGEMIAVAGGAKDSTITEDDVVVLTLNDNGMIRDCSKACGKLLGCASDRLIWRHVSMLLPQLAKTALMLGGQINPRLRFLSHIGHRFEVVAPDGVRFISKLFFNDVEHSGRHNLRVIICPVDGEVLPRRY